MTMRSKRVLLLSAALIGSTALVASAQNPEKPREEPRRAVGVITTSEAVTVDETGPVTILRGAPADGDHVTVTRPARRAYSVYATMDGFDPRGQEGRLAQKAEALARQIAEAKTTGEAQSLHAELHKVLQDQFALRQKRHEEEIEKLETQVKKLREMVSMRQENRMQIIESRVRELLNEAKGLGW